MDHNILKIKKRYLLEYKVLMSNLYMNSVCCTHFQDDSKFMLWFFEVLWIWNMTKSFYSWRFKNKRAKQNKIPYFLHSQLLKHKYSVFLPGQKNKIQVQEHLSHLICYFYNLNIRILCLLVIYFFKIWNI